MDKNYVLLDLQYPYNGAVEHLYPVVLFGKETLVLVDCGYPGSLPQLEEQMKKNGLELSRLTTLVLTHQDDDHMGAAAELKEKYPHICIAASETEAPYITGERKNLRLQQAEDLQALLPQEQKAWGEAFCQRLRQVRPVKVDLLLHPGDVFDWGGRCQILATPGHTPGHISLLLPDTVITGDAAVLEAGELAVANPQFCLDIGQAEASLEKIKQLHCTAAVCCHGGTLHC